MLLKRWWPGTESNRRRQPFQGCALPAELPGHVHSEGATQVFFRGPQQACFLGWRTHSRVCSALRNIRIIAAPHRSAKFLTAARNNHPPLSSRSTHVSIIRRGLLHAKKNRSISLRLYSQSTIHYHYFCPPTALLPAFFCSHCASVWESRCLISMQ
jgi:hypothetical protein